MITSHFKLTTELHGSMNLSVAGAMDETHHFQSQLNPDTMIMVFAVRWGYSSEIQTRSSTGVDRKIQA